MKKSVCVILFDLRTKKILAVSRKDNHTDFGLVGGKVDDTDDSPEFAIIRETKEETGLDISNLKLINRCDYDGYDTHCYLAEWRGRVHTEENHIVEWMNPEDLIKGSFGDYNLERFKELGIL